jgi:hypothetical protein
MPSQQQIDANRANALKSTGPQTPQGKAAVSQNALKHGLSAQQACIPGEDQDEFNATLQSFQDELKPVGPLQTLLVQQIVMAAWRLARIRLLEGGIFQLRSVDEVENIEKDYQNLAPRTRLGYLFVCDVRGPNALATLARYEGRVERSFYRALHELQRLQAAPKPNVTKQTQSETEPAPNPEPQQDLTPPSGNPQITKSLNPQIADHLPGHALVSHPSAGQHTAALHLAQWWTKAPMSA